MKTDSRLIMIALLIMPLLSACGASKIGDPNRGRSLALIIVEEWELKVDDSIKTFSEIVGRDARDVGERVGMAGAMAGCIAGGAVGATGGPPAMERGCLLVGIFVGLPGYVVGFGIGAVVGAVEASIAAFQDELTDADIGALVAAFEESDPGAELAAALKQTIRHTPDASIARLESAQPAECYVHLAGQGYPFVVVLRITEFYLSNYSPGSRIHLAVEGEVFDTATNTRLLVRDWTYISDSVGPTKFAENESKLLKSQMKMAWAEISSKISADILGGFNGTETARRAGQIGRPTVELDWQPLDQPPAVKLLPLTVGTYFSSKFGDYEHIQTENSVSLVFLIGQPSLNAFEQVFSGMFEKVVSLKCPPPVQADEPFVEAVIEPTIATIELSGPGIQRRGTKRANVTYSITMSLPDGQILASWNVTGTGIAECRLLRCVPGEEIGFALRDAIGNFAVRFYEQPEIKRWLQEINAGS